MYQPKQIIQVEKAGGRTLQSKGFAQSIYDSFMSPENAAFTRSLTAFAVSREGHEPCRRRTQF